MDKKLDKNIALNKNHLVTTLGKPAGSFTKQDIIDYCTSMDIEMINFMYPAGDGRLKTLNFVINTALLHSLPRPLCRDSHRDDALHVLRQGWPSARKLSGIYPAKGLRGVPRGYRT